MRVQEHGDRVQGRGEHRVGRIQRRGGCQGRHGDRVQCAAAEPSDGLHPATETAVATNSMAAKGNEAVAATVLADQTEEGDEACHLTGGKCFLSSPFSVAFSLSLAVLRA